MKRHVLLLALLSSSWCHAAIFEPIHADQERVKFGSQMIFDGVKSLRVYKENDGQWHQCSAVRVARNEGFSTFVTAAHCLTNIRKAYVCHTFDKVPVSFYFIHPFYKTDKRYDIGAFNVEEKSSSLTYSFWQGEEIDLNILIFSGYGMMPDNTNPRQAHYVSVMQIEDGIRLGFKSITNSDLISSHSTSVSDSGGGFFVQDEHGQLLLVGVHAVGASQNSPFPSYGTLIDRDFQSLLSNIFPSSSKKTDKHKDLSKTADAKYLPEQEMERKIAQIETQPGRLFEMGIRHSEGFEAPLDAKRALDLFKQAATKGHLLAQYTLGLHYYYKGKNAPENQLNAFIWWTKAADQGLAEAQFNLGHMHYKGQGVKQDKATAIQWWKKAAAQGLAEAQFNLYQILHKGKGVNQDKAIQWWKKMTILHPKNTQQNARTELAKAKSFMENIISSE